MFVLFTDFGWKGPYVGQMKAVLAREAAGVPIIDLLHDAPVFDARASAYLLAALAPEFPAGAIFVCVVDPGVGGERRPLMLRADERWYVAPDNGLLNVVALRSRRAEWHAITWRPARLSATFHGRDLFAPAAARLARGELPGAACAPPSDLERWPADLAQVIYVDPYGNATTGLRASAAPADAFLRCCDRCFQPVTTFAEAPPGAAIWYANSNGLVELAINQGHAARSCGLTVGAGVSVDPECG